LNPKTGKPCGKDFGIGEGGLRMGLISPILDRGYKHTLAKKPWGARVFSGAPRLTFFIRAPGQCRALVVYMGFMAIFLRFASH
jgi:hypothetical protein